MGVISRRLVWALVWIGWLVWAARPAQASCVSNCKIVDNNADYCANLCNWFGGSTANNNVDCSSPGHATNPACGGNDDSGCEPGTWLGTRCWEECDYNCWDVCYSCFPAGTKVRMAEGGTKNIEDIKIGETVISQTERGELKESRVKEIENPTRDHLCRVEWASGGYLEVTDEHPLRAKDGWRVINPANGRREAPQLALSELQVGDELVSENGWKKVRSIACRSQAVSTYNLILDGDVNTYFANGILAHNKKRGCWTECGDPIWVCKEKCKFDCWPCNTLDIDPDNLTATPLSETSVRLDWTPKGRFNDEGVQQYIQYTNNPSNYFQCNVYYSQNPCTKIGPLDPSVNTYTLTGLVPNTRYYIQVEGYYGLSGSCPADTKMEYLLYPPLCWLSPESGEINAGESAALTMNIGGGTVNEVRFESSNTGAASVTSPDSAAPYETTVSGVGGGTATVTGRTYIGSTNVCTDTATITVTGSSQAWWQVVDGNVHANAGGWKGFNALESKGKPPQLSVCLYCFEAINGLTRQSVT